MITHPRRICSISTACVADKTHEDAPRQNKIKPEQRLSCGGSCCCCSHRNRWWVEREREREVLVRHWLVPQAVAGRQGSHVDVSVMGSNVDSDHERFFTSSWDLLASPDKWPVEEDSLPDNLYQSLMKSFHFVGGDNDITALVNLILAIAFEMKYLIKRWIRSEKVSSHFIYWQLSRSHVTWW